jgi:hypothetical protein
VDSNERIDHSDKPVESNIANTPVANKTVGDNAAIDVSNVADTSIVESDPLRISNTPLAGTPSPSKLTNVLYAGAVAPREEAYVPVTDGAKLGLDAADKVLESFSCALYPKRGLLTHGR